MTELMIVLLVFKFICNFPKFTCFFLKFQCISHQPISTTEFNLRINHVKASLSSCKQSIFFLFRTGKAATRNPPPSHPFGCALATNNIHPFINRAVSDWRGNSGKGREGSFIKLSPKFPHFILLASSHSQTLLHPTQTSEGKYPTKRSQWSCGPRRASAVAHLLGLRVRILRRGMDVCLL